VRQYLYRRELTPSEIVGLATAKLFNAHGAKVIITARSGETYAEAKKTLAPLGFDIVQCDVGNLAQLDALYAHIKATYSGLDVLFANAGTGKFVPTASMDEATFDDMMNINVKGVYFTVQKALPLLREGSSVVLNASIVTMLGMPGSSVYSATKAAVRSFARTWTAEIPPSKVRFNVISPGFTATPGISKLGMTQEQIQAFGEAAVDKTPAKRFGTSEEMAKTTLFLASADSAYIAGAEIFVDGGYAQV